MSNVTPEEIVALTASAFAIPTRHLSHAGDPYVSRMVPRAAVDVVVYLLRRHTDAPKYRIGKLLDYANSGGTNASKLIARSEAVPELMARVPELAEMVAQIEAAIDDIHERRLAEQERHDAGTRALGGETIPPLTPEAADTAFANATVR